MTGIRIHHWTRISRRNIMAPVSTILLQENSFEARNQRAFFLSVSRIVTNLIRKRSGAKGHTLEMCHGPLTLCPYTGFICIHATDMRDRRRCAARGTPHRILRLLARSWVVPVLRWRAFFFVPYSCCCVRHALHNSFVVVLESSQDSAMMKFAPRVFYSRAGIRHNKEPVQ
jgi:hypothetical protein